MMYHCVPFRKEVECRIALQGSSNSRLRLGWLRTALDSGVPSSPAGSMHR